MTQEEEWNEKWVAIKGYEKQYSISNMGRVKSKGRQVKCFGTKTKWLPEKILANSKGGGKARYLTVIFSHEGKKRVATVHKLVAIAFLGHMPDGYNLVVDHINGDKHDNRVENLQLITPAENVAKGFRGTCPNCGYQH